MRNGRHGAYGNETWRFHLRRTTITVKLSVVRCLRAKEREFKLELEEGRRRNARKSVLEELVARLLRVLAALNEVDGLLVRADVPELCAP